MEGSKFVRTVACMSYHSRTLPSRHFAYEIRVKWSTGQSALIYRRYSQFFNLQCKLLDSFPLEAGTYDPSRRTLPFLPGKKILGNFSEKTAEKRKAKLDTYLKTLIELANISSSSLVLTFFESKESDLKSLLDRKNSRSSVTSVKGHVISDPISFPQYIVIEDYAKSQNGELSVSAGTVLLVIEKKHTGWWLAQTLDGEFQGWVPATYLDPVYSGIDGDSSDEDEFRTLPAEPEKYIASSDYMAERPDELTVLRGCVVEVLNKPLDGWWMCSYGGRRAMFPSAYLRKANTLKAKELQALSRQMSLEQSSPASSHVQSRHKRLSHYAPPRRDRSKPKPPRPPALNVRKVTEYAAVADFVNTMDEGVDLKEGCSIQVLTKDDSGWWYVEVGGAQGGAQGWAPSTYIQPIIPLKNATNASQPSPGFTTSAIHTGTNVDLKSRPSTNSVSKPQPAAKYTGLTQVPADPVTKPKPPARPAGKVAAAAAGKLPPPSRPDRPPSGKSSPKVARALLSAEATNASQMNTTVCQARAKLHNLLPPRLESNKQNRKLQGANSGVADSVFGAGSRAVISQDDTYYSAPSHDNNDECDTQLSVAELRKKLAVNLGR